MSLDWILRSSWHLRSGKHLATSKLSRTRSPNVQPVTSAIAPITWKKRSRQRTSASQRRWKRLVAPIAATRANSRLLANFLACSKHTLGPLKMNPGLPTFVQKPLKAFLLTLKTLQLPLVKSHHLESARSESLSVTRSRQETLYSVPANLNRWKWSTSSFPEQTKNGTSTGSTLA